MSNSHPALQRFLRELQRQRVADAYLLIGASRSALQDLAIHFAAAYLELDPPQRAWEHPECLVWDPAALGTRGLKVEHIAHRKEGVLNVEEALRYRATGSGKRALVLYEADYMNADAQAALLKTSEEPPEGTLLILTAVHQANLLPALRSRCRTYRIAAPPAQELKLRAAELGYASEQAAVLQDACGNLETALSMPEEERQALLDLAANFQAWMDGTGTLEAWLSIPEGGQLVEQRARAEISWAACLGWLVRKYSVSEPHQTRRLDHTARYLLGALVDLSGQVTPAVVVEDLRRQLGFHLPVN